jgi:cation diffusion facilitator CzcD-associated flavoprotein CzcO
MSEPGREVDVLIVGAGISGIGAACHLSRDLPGRSFQILERRQGIGGTWDLFRYPGVRSDSDMFTFGYRFRPWLDMNVLADGTSIRAYVNATADEYGVREHISFGRAVERASWSSAAGRWTVEARDEASGEAEIWTARFLFACTGYYNYDHGYRPPFPGEDAFTGTLVHPQQWPADLDYSGKRVLVIGSGATAVTLVPAMAVDAAHVTMLQRSPSYVLALPAVDTISQALRRVLPAGVVYKMARARNIALQRMLYAFSRRYPDRMRKLVLAGARKRLGPGADLSHFTPRYDPWDQRLCIIPDGDLFDVIRDGHADVVTGTIETFTPDGVRLTDGTELAADIIVTATGLQVQLLGGAEIAVDGVPVSVPEKLTYKAVLIEDLPNAAVVFGYTNASWTLKADLASEFVVRLLRHMDSRGYTRVVPRAEAVERTDQSVLSSLNSGYVVRGDPFLPRQGRRGPWQVRNDFWRDAPMLRRGPIPDAALEFSADPVPVRVPADA